MIESDGTGGVLEGTAGEDVIVGTSADEHMRGHAGNDLFLVEAGGASDTLDGGEGFDTLMLGGVQGPPVAGRPAGEAWTLMLDNPGTTWTEGEAGLDLSEPASGRIVFADGTRVDFASIERITW